MPDTGDGSNSAEAADSRQRNALLKADALQTDILTSANFSIIATDAKGVTKLINVGAERMLGYKAIEAINRIGSSDIHDSQAGDARFAALSLELETPIAPGVKALAFNTSRDIQCGLRAGFISYITKPVKVVEFMAALDAAMLVSRSATRDTA